MLCRRLFTSRCIVLRNAAMSTNRNLSHRPTIGVLQMTCTPDKQSNFSQAKDLIEKAKNKGAEMVFLPECFDLVGQSKEETFSLAETINGDIINRYKALAKDLKLWLSLGGFHEKSADATEKKLRNTHLLINSSGDICERYSKIHMFDIDGAVSLTESSFTKPGDHIAAPVNTPVGCVAMAICYDMRFPELAMAHTQMGAEILTFPSAFTVPTGLAHWQVLLRSRAIENQCYVIAAAQVGKHHAKRSSYGHAMVVDPWGTVIAECRDQVDFCTAEIDLDYLRKRRSEMPVWQHRRHDLYGQVTVSTTSDIDAQKTYAFDGCEIPSSGVFYKTALSYAFVNRKPVLPGHVLVASLRICERFSELTPVEVADMFCCAQKVADKVACHYGGNAVTVAMQDGKQAGQTVQHVHVHILPRKAGDFERNDDIYVHLQNHDKEDNEAYWRTHEDMAQEAAILRTYFN